MVRVYKRKLEWQNYLAGYTDEEILKTALVRVKSGNTKAAKQY